MTNKQTLHGVLLRVHKRGVFIQGPAGIGKSQLALDLIDRGHVLICDDAPEFFIENNNIIGQCPENLIGLLQVRFLGILDIKQLFGNTAVDTKTTLDLCVQLNHSINSQALLAPHTEKTTILGKTVPRVQMPVCSALMVDTLISRYNTAIN